MLRMSKLTDYGTMVLAQLAASDPGWTTAGQVADATHLGQPTVSKLLKALVHAGLVRVDVDCRRPSAESPQKRKEIRVIDRRGS